jgi:hypothetical protein
VGGTTAAQLGSYTTSGHKYALVIDDSPSPAGDHWLSQEILNIYAGEPLGADGACHTECYYHWVQPQSVIYLTFFFLYACNGGLMTTFTKVRPGWMSGATWGFAGHEGDWESVTLGFYPGPDDDHVEPIFVARETHGDPHFEWLPSAAIPIVDLKPIEVWSGLHSHASYAAPGDYPLGALFSNPGVDHCNSGVVWNSGEHLVSLDGPAAPPWVPYVGRWGTQRVIPSTIPLAPPLLDSGPTGPTDKPSWTGPPTRYTPLVFSKAATIESQGTSVPALANFNSTLYMLYTGSDSSEIFQTNVDSKASGPMWTDNVRWTKPFEIGQQSSMVALETFGGYLHLAYVDSEKTDLWHSRTKDGHAWIDTNRIPGQTSKRAYAPALCSFNGYLYMVYTDSDSWRNQLYVTRTQDGSTWRDTHAIPFQGAAQVALAEFNGQLRMVYGTSDASTIYQSSSEDGLFWSNPETIPNQYGTFIPALAVFDDWLYMAYTATHSSQLYVTRSNDGESWRDTQEIHGQGTSVPAAAVFQGALMLAYSDSRHSDLWQTFLDEPHTYPGAART